MKTLSKLFLLCSFLLLQISCLAAFAASPLGYWKTIDDVSGNAKSIIKISGTPRYLSGTVVKLFPGAQKTCSANCPGSLKNKPIIGMTVMYGLKQNANNPNEWSGGSIFDPKTGQVYRCMLTVSDNGRSLEVRGYVGISLLGRSQTWIKVGK